ncbi:DUF3299 domain-containing protein [bacterium]|nr:DUF3299 domain-containing protein [bacterium]
MIASRLLRPIAVIVMALAAGSLLTSPPGSVAATPSDSPRGAAIDGSEDTPTSKTLDAPSFQDLDALGLRPKTMYSNAAAIQELAEIKSIEWEGKPFKSLNFGVLATYRYTLPEPGDLKREDTELPARFRGQIPARIRELNEQDVVLTGFVVPLEVEKGKLKSFVLVRNQMMCCYGVVPEINEWVHVIGEGSYRAPFVQDVPIRAYGKLEVGERIRGGQVMSVYRLRLTHAEATAPAE